MNGQCGSLGRSQRSHTGSSSFSAVKKKQCKIFCKVCSAQEVETGQTAAVNYVRIGFRLMNYSWCCGCEILY